MCDNVINKCLEWGWIVLPLWEIAERQQSCRVTILETVVISPQAEMLLKGSLGDSKRTVPCGILEPSKATINKRKIMVAPLVVNTVNTSVVPIHLNPGEDPVTLHKGTTVATFFAVDAIGPEPSLMQDPIVEAEQVRTTFSEGTAEEEDLVVPSHLQDLFQTSTKLLRVRVSNIKILLIQYQQQYSTKDGDLGLTGLAKHKIDTGVHPQ